MHAPGPDGGGAEAPSEVASLSDLARRFAVYAAVARARAAALARDSAPDAAVECTALRRQAWAYHTAALRAAAVAETRVGWLLAYLDGRSGEPVTGPCYAAMAVDVRTYLGLRR